MTRCLVACIPRYGKELSESNKLGTNGKCKHEVVVCYSIECAEILQMFD